MSCVEKRHMSHRVGSMLHHRFPNGFTDMFMDETDREVSTLTDRAFRSLCIGDDALNNDEFLYGYSPFSCHKPLAGEPLKKTHHKESKKPGHKMDKNDAQPWKQQQQKNISNMSSFLKALSATEKSCEGMLIKNGGMTDSNGESWDKSALRSIQRELSEFSSDYQANLRDGHYRNIHLHRSDDSSANKMGKDAALPTGKSSKVKNGKNTVKLKKLNIKNLFLHSEFSPFQTWRDVNRFAFGQEETVTSLLPTDNIPKWYDLPFYKELTDAHRKETLHTVETQSCQKAAAEPPPPTAPKPNPPPPPPPKVLPKPTVTPAEKRCSSDIGDGLAAPWRRNRSRASETAVNLPGVPSQDSCFKTVDENLSLVKKEAVEVKVIEEVSSLASTPFSICQLMTPVIPSRQPTETSEILQTFFSPSALDLPLRPHSEAKVTTEPSVKRDSYKSLASSILFNLKDNRKRVKSRYSPPKFKTLELPEGGVQSPQSDHLKLPHASSDGNGSGLSTPAVKDVRTVCSPILEPADTPAVSITTHDADTPLTDDYLLSNLLQTKSGAPGSNGTEENPISNFRHTKNSKSPKAIKKNYPSLNLYKKASPDDSDMKYLQVQPSDGAPARIRQTSETNERSSLVQNKELSPATLPTSTGLSPKTLNVNKDLSPMISPHATENERLSTNPLLGKRLSSVPDKPLVQDTNGKDFGGQPASKEKDASGQTISTMDVIRAAREAINAAKTKALCAAQPESNNKSISDKEERKEREGDEKITYSKERFSGKTEMTESQSNALSKSRKESTSAALVGKNSKVKKEPPPVPKRNFAKSDTEFALDKNQPCNVDKPSNYDVGGAQLDLPPKENESATKQGKTKHLFSATQNNYIKNQRCSVEDDEQTEANDECELSVNTRTKIDDKMMSVRETRDSEHIINDLHALKELERARLGDHVFENSKNKLGDININEEAKAKNDLISRELRNIKKGMMSMRGNTSAKREIFDRKEKELRKQEAFAKIDSNVIVNKALINDNYDKAKMALEEIISERQKRRDKFSEDVSPLFEENASEESYVTRTQQCKTVVKDGLMEGREKQNGSTSTLREKELNERFSDLKEKNHIRQILPQTEVRLGETHRLGGRIALPGMDRVDSLHQTKAKQVNDKLQVSEEGEVKKIAAPSVPPRSKKGCNRREESITKETVSHAAIAEAGKYENSEVRLNDMTLTGSGKQELESDLLIKGATPIQISEAVSHKETKNVVNNTKSQSTTATDVAQCLPVSPSNYPQSENRFYLSPKPSGDENVSNNLQADLSLSRETTFENSNAKAEETHKAKPIAHLKPEYLITPGDRVIKNSVAEDAADKINKHTEEVNVEAFGETPRTILSPLLTVNGVNVSQSPPDQASLSSKSSYFSVDSALHRNTETESNVYHSLENLIGEVEEVQEEARHISRNTKQDSDRTEGEYYSFSDYESEPQVINRLVTSPQKETGAPHSESRNQTAHDENNQTSSSNTFSPTLGIPSLFKVKDNTSNLKVKKTVQPWALAGSTSVSHKGEEELHQTKENIALPLANETTATFPPKIIKPKEVLTNQTPPPLNLQTEAPKKPQLSQFLTVPQEDDRSSGVSPSSEGMESLVTTSTADTAVPVVSLERDISKVPSERSGSVCSGNESQTGLPKPPAVLPKSEKAVLKAIKLTTRRMKKEEAQKSSQTSSQSSSKHRADRHKGEKSEQKSSSGSRKSKSSERKHREKVEDGQSHHGSMTGERGEQRTHERRGRNSESHHHHHDRREMKTSSQRHSQDLLEGDNHNKEALPSMGKERQGRGSDKHTRDKSDKRHYSTDRVISNVPVYKAQVNGNPTADRPLHRSQSIDRYSAFERRLSADIPVNEKSDQRTQRIEKSIMDGLQQRGRARDKGSRDNPLRRSHSIDAYGAEVSRPLTLSRQSSHTSHSSQLSRQSSIEHTIVTQSFPMTQRKLLQDPDSGQYFFVDMPVQVKTKTFFDPETGSYVQLPVQPPEGAIPQASPMEVLTPPLVVYHGFVPVPLSPMAQKPTIQTTHMEPEEYEQRHLERSRQMLCAEGRPYLEPVFGQHDHILGEFMGTEELGCPS